MNKGFFAPGEGLEFGVGKDAHREFCANTPVTNPLTLCMLSCWASRDALFEDLGHGAHGERGTVG